MVTLAMIEGGTDMVMLVGGELDMVTLATREDSGALVFGIFAVRTRTKMNKIQLTFVY